MFISYNKTKYDYCSSFGSPLGQALGITTSRILDILLNRKMQGKIDTCWKYTSSKIIVIKNKIILYLVILSLKDKNQKLHSI